MAYYFKDGGFWIAKKDQDGNLVYPAGSVKITAKQHAALLAAQAKGKKIVVSKSGRPSAAWPPAPSVKELREEANLECGRRVIAAYGAKDRIGEILYRINKKSNDAQYREHLRLLEKCTALKVKILGLSTSSRRRIDVTTDTHWQV
ncbi:MAG: hypothetical protein HRT36_05490 [Alphaproteobacteria bacterium]|nr:hypothetical protein [Alphaproteobacteria bacterium]